jgi:hypothetical protein
MEVPEATWKPIDFGRLYDPFGAGTADRSRRYIPENPPICKLLTAIC